MSYQFADLEKDELIECNGGNPLIYFTVVGILATIWFGGYTISKDVSYNKTWSNYLEKNRPTPCPAPTPIP